MLRVRLKETKHTDKISNAFSLARASGAILLKHLVQYKLNLRNCCSGHLPKDRRCQAHLLQLPTNIQSKRSDNNGSNIDSARSRLNALEDKEEEC
jgi:hypothetical protein